MVEMVGSRSKRRGCVRNGGLAFETTGSHSKRRARIRNGRLAFETTGVCSKQRGCVRNDGVCSKQWGGVFETTGSVGVSRLARGRFERRHRGGDLSFQVAASVGFLLFRSKI